MEQCWGGSSCSALGDSGTLSPGFGLGAHLQGAETRGVH